MEIQPNRYLRVTLLSVFFLVATSQFSLASIYNFNITYDGTTQSLDAGSDPMAGTSLLVNDGFKLDFRAAGNDFWKVENGNWATSIYAALLVLDSAGRTGNSTATFFLDGVVVAQDIDNGIIQGSVHIGAQVTTLTSGMLFDQLVVDYTLLNDQGVGTTIQNDFVDFSFTNSSVLASYQSAVPEPSAIVLWSLLGMVGLGSVRRRVRA